MSELINNREEHLDRNNEINGQFDITAYQTGHPVHTFILENKKISTLLVKIQSNLEQFLIADSEISRSTLLDNLNQLWEIDRHYSRKENLLFPFLEKYGINGPTTHMWAIDDFIRKAIKEARNGISSYSVDQKNTLVNHVNFVIEQGLEMIYREENILLPMALRKLSEDDWLKIAKQSPEIGYCLIDSVTE
nr:hemerythrin domain-containing protein [Aquibacillus saliphilus]